ncbi:MAG: L,D-transpeptidase [Gammaproteobacteria bacterium]|nr:L,D-transpeptidase [Gammaproteobacteria bacterium]
MASQELDTKTYIHIDISEQSLRLLSNDKLIFKATISSATNGPGELFGSECTPTGWHQVRAKIGHNCDENSVFIARRYTGEIYTPELAKQYPERDWILTRILWLSGLEPGKNRLGKVDSMRRYIYIHGTPDTEPMGIPASHGCIRMRNQDIIQLYDLIEPHTRVLISK